VTKKNKKKKKKEESDGGDGFEDYRIEKADQQRKKTGQGIRGSYDYKTRFIYDPALGDLGFDADKHKHINKNIIVTNLSRKDNEPEQARGYLRGIQLLRHYDEKAYYELFKDQKSGEVKKREVNKAYYEKLPEEKRMKTTKNKFQPALDQKHGELYALTSVASGTHAGLMRTAETDRVQQEKTIRQDLESGKRDFDKPSPRNNSGRRQRRNR